MRRLLFAVLALVASALSLLIPVAATVNSSVSKTIALGDGVTTVFSFSFIGVAPAYITAIFTDASGNETVLTQGSGTTQYQIVLNAPVQGAIWGLGGRVTYNPSGTPIAAGTTLTIFRTLPLTQAITLQNQASIATLGKGAETGLDTGVMQGQQISEAIGRALQMNITNTAPPAQLPPAAQVAGLGLCFDGTGNNVIGCSLAPSGIISSAMAPVVGAASLAAGRLAFGLGSMAQENINGGTCGGATIQDDGSAGGANGIGYARVVFATAQDATNQAVTCAFHGTQRIASGFLTYTLPRANTLFNGFTFSISAVVGGMTVVPNAADNFQGVASGTSIQIPNGSACVLATNAASSGSWYLTCNGQNPLLGVNINANALTIVLASPPIAFRNLSAINGAPLWALPAGGISITIPNGATLGTTNGVPFRVWVLAAYNGGTPLLGVATCSSLASLTVYPCASWENRLLPGDPIGSAAVGGGVLYTSSAVVGDAFRIIGYLEYGNGLTTAGTWNSGPTLVQLCLPPFSCPRPGQTLQTVFSTNAGGATAGGTAVTTGLTATIGLSATVNLVKVQAASWFQGQGATNSASGVLATLRRASTVIGPQFAASIGVSGSTSAQFAGAPMSFLQLDAPQTGGAYNLFFSSTGGTAIFEGGNMELDEIMGTLDPANDNTLSLRLVG